MNSVPLPKPTSRAMATALRTYHRPHSDKDGRLESWDQVVDRVISHQRWLWERSAGRTLKDEELAELEELRRLITGRYLMPSGRTLWLGGTEISQTRESSMFNCAFSYVETVYDVVDVLWLLLQGCGVGFQPVTGTLNGFRFPLKEVKVVRSKLIEKGGNEFNVPMCEKLSVLFGYDLMTGKKQKEEVTEIEEDTKEEVRTEIEKDSRAFFEIYTPVNILKEVKYRITGK